jgi:ABC-type dipeptide/oligopeptide/nickel transport system permease component
VNLARYIIRRLLLMILVLFGISVIVFYLSRGYPSKFPPWGQYVTLAMSPAEINYIKQIHGFNLPLYEQYFYWLRDAVSGSWGISKWAGNQATLSVFVNRFPLTVELAVASIIITVAIGLPLGILSATKNNRLPDHFSRLIALSGYSIPIFWLGFLFQLLFSYYFKLWGLPNHPSSGYVDQSFTRSAHVIAGIPILDAIIEGNLAYLASSFVHLILPALTLAFASLGYLTRIVRSSMLEVLKQDYITMARSKGLAERVVIYRHALRNALIPIVTVTGVLFASLLGGVVVIEYVFSWPGVGSAALQATFQNDTNFLMLYTIVAAAIIVIANLAVDVTYGILDPRIRFS